MAGSTAALEAFGDSNVRRIVRDGNILAFAQRLGNGKWGAYSVADRRLTARTFATPNAVLKWFLQFGEELPKE